MAIHKKCRYFIISM